MPGNSDQKTVALGAVGLVISRFTGVGFSAVACSVLLRQLGADFVGVFAISSVLPSLTATLLLFGMPSVFPYFINRSEYCDNTLMKAGLFWVGALSPIVLAAWFIAAPAIANYVFDARISSHTAMLLGLAVPAKMITFFIQSMFRSKRLVRTAVANQLSEGVILGGCGIVAAFWPATADGLAKTVVVGALVSALVWGVICYRMLGPSQSSLTLLKLRALVFMGLRGHLGAVASLANYRLDVLLLGVLADMRVVGIYTIVTKVAEVGRYLSVAITQMWAPFAAAAHASAVWDSSRTLYVHTWRFSLAILIVLAVGGPWLLSLFGPGLEEGYVAFYLLLIGLGAGGGNGALQAYNIAIGRPEMNTICALVSLGLTIGLNLLLIPWFGINGAAAASMFAYIVYAIALAAIFLRSPAAHNANASCVACSN